MKEKLFTILTGAVCFAVPALVSWAALVGLDRALKVIGW